MNAARDLGRTVADWLDGEASAAGSERVLAEALDRIAGSGQERYVTQRLLGDRVGRSPQVRIALAIAVVALLGAVGTVAVGSLRQEPRPLPVGPAGNGWIVFEGQAEAGPNLDGPDASRTSADLYFVREGERPHLVIGAVDDQLAQMCPAFSPDGTRLAYLEYDRRFVAATPAPAPPGASAPAAPVPAQGQASASGSPWTLNVVDVAADGSIGGPTARVILDEASWSCAEWSPDGQRLALFASSQEGPRQLWLVGLDGTSMPLGPAAATNDRAGASAFAWSPDGSAIAVLGDRAVLLIPADGGPSRTLLDGGYQVVEWSPDGTTLAVVLGRRIQLLGVDGAVVSPPFAGSPDGDPVTVAWSLDGTSIFAFDGDLVVYDRQGRTLDALSVTLPASLAGRAPSLVGLSPDGSRLLLNVSGPDADGTLLTVDPRGSGQVAATELFPPTYAYRGSGDWQPEAR
jgi:hypothetical protein